MEQESKLMGQPASFKSPRDKETVLACRHDRAWKRKPIYIGHSSGLGALVKTPTGPVFIRWVVLCWLCRLGRWVLRRRPLQWARREIVWGAEEK